MESHSLSKNLFFLFLLLVTNLLTFFFFSSSIFTIDTFSSTSEESRITASTSTSLPSKFLPSTSPPLPSEFVASTEPQLLPFGHNSNFDSDTIHPPVGQACTLFPSDLKRYMSYTVSGPCPDDELLAQKLLLKGCEPLPRRRCRPRAPVNFADPHPLPASLWTTPSDTSVVWSHYSCKNYTCLINRMHQKQFDDCKDCFDLNGREKTRWITPGGSLGFTIDQVISLKKPSTIRIGLDIGGGSGTFAVRMRERDITIVTTSMNFNGPFNSFIASRGVVPLYISVSQRLPFFDNTLDIVHSMHVLSNWIPTQMLGFILFDVYRILRPGGLFWLDHFFCLEDQLTEVYVPLIESVGFQKLKWVVGSKLDRGPHLKEMYLSAVLEKPVKKQS